MHIAPPPSGFFLKTMYMAIRGQGALRQTRAAGSGERALPKAMRARDNQCRPELKKEGDTMRTTRILLAAGWVGAIAHGMPVPANAQYYYPRPPDYDFAYPPPDTRYGYGWTRNDCPPSWTVRSGNCVPYGWHTWGRPSGKRRRPINAARR